MGKVPYFFIGDDTFPLTGRLLKPYGEQELTPSQIRFNSQLSRARMVVECAFGHLYQRFGIFNVLKTKRKTTILAITTACHIHNYLKFRNPVRVSGDGKW